MVSARVPLDVDLEDKLLYGLTPTRLAYLVIGLLAAFSIWSTHWAPLPVRAACAIVVGAVAVTAAWGRWRGRPLDSWVIGFAAFGAATDQLSWNAPRRVSRAPPRPS